MAGGRTGVLIKQTDLSRHAVLGGGNSWEHPVSQESHFDCGVVSDMGWGEGPESGALPSSVVPLIVKVKSLSRVRLPATPWTAAYQAPPSRGFSKQEYWSGKATDRVEGDKSCWGEPSF